MRVLVIDDERFIADTLVMILRGSGHEAMAAYDGRAALECAASFGPSVVLSDVFMAGMNGIETCQQLQLKYPDCHIFLFSGQAGTSELMCEVWKKGHRWELLEKPIEPEELLAKLASLDAK